MQIEDVGLRMMSFFPKCFWKQLGLAKTLPSNELNQCVTVCVTVCVIDQGAVCLLLCSRDHHGAHHLHHHHWSERLNASGLLHQSCGHLPVGQLCVCVSVCT